MRPATAEAVRRDWANLTREQREKRVAAIRAGIARRFDPVSPQEQARQLRLGKRRALRDLDLLDDVPRCGVCGLMEPHECLDGAQVRRSS